MMFNGEGAGSSLNNTFDGIYEGFVDEENRLVIHSDLEKRMGEMYVITKGLDGCISAFSEEAWNHIGEKLNDFVKGDGKRRQLSRLLLGCACCIGDEEKITIPEILLDYADIKRDVIIADAGDHMEIWSKKRWNEGFTG